jgi:hypothetical protein
MSARMAWSSAVHSLYRGSLADHAKGPRDTLGEWEQCHSVGLVLSPRKDDGVRVWLAERPRQIRGPEHRWEHVLATALDSDHALTRHEPANGRPASQGHHPFQRHLERPLRRGIREE